MNDLRFPVYTDEFSMANGAKNRVIWNGAHGMNGARHDAHG